MGLYVLKMDPMVLAGRGCRSAKQYDGHASHLGQGEERHPGVRVSVPYAFSTGVFLIYGYIAMLLS